MARIRTIKPEIWMSPQVMNLSHGARLLFIGLITQSDDEGRGTADPRRLKAAIFGGDDDTSSSVRRWLDDIQAQGLVALYEAPGHGLLFQLTSWRSHQSIDRPKKSAYPTHVSVSDRRAIDVEASTSREGSEGKGSEGKGSDRTVPAFDGWSFIEHRIRPIYPAGTYRDNTWIQASKDVELLVEQREDPDQIVRLVTEYSAQQQAMGKVGTQFVLSPAKFFGRGGDWKGPFPLPAAKPTVAPFKRKTADELEAERDAREAAGGTSVAV